MKIINHDNKGFTLIEMLVVVAIVGLLSAVVVVGLTGAREKARDSRRIADIRQIQNDLELNYQSSSGYQQVTLPEGPQEPDEYKLDINGDTYLLGVELEGSENANNDTATCPTDLQGVTNAFCVSPDSSTNVSE